MPRRKFDPDNYNYNYQPAAATMLIELFKIIFAGLVFIFNLLLQPFKFLFKKKST
jgi:hypothetical protein